MRILIHHNGDFFPNSGIGRVIEVLKKSIESEGHIVEFCCANNYLSLLNGRLHFLRHSPLTAILFAKWLGKKDFDVVFSQTPEAAFDAVWAKKLVGKKFSVTTHCHGLDKVVGKEWLKELRVHKTRYSLITDLYLCASIFKGLFGMRWADKITAVSKSVAKDVEKYYKRKAIVIPNTVDVSEFEVFDKKETRKELGFEDSDIVVLFVGSPAWRKGLHYLLDALKLLPNNYKLQIVGYDINIKQKNVFVEKWVGTRQLSKYYSAVDVLCVPSVYEPFGMVYLEAQHFGLPCIGCIGTGAEEVIKNGELVPKRDGLAIRNAIVNITKEKCF